MSVSIKTGSVVGKMVSVGIIYPYRTIGATSRLSGHSPYFLFAVYRVVPRNTTMP